MNVATMTDGKKEHGAFREPKYQTVRLSESSENGSRTVTCPVRLDP